MSSSSNSPKEISSTRTAPSPTDESLWTVSLGIKSFSSTSGWISSPSSSTHAPSSRTTHSSSRILWYWRESAPPGATVMILTVQGRLWVYCSNPPQGFSTFTEGGRRSKLNPLERSGRGGSLTKAAKSYSALGQGEAVLLAPVEKRPLWTRHLVRKRLRRSGKLSLARQGSL